MDGKGVVGKIGVYSGVNGFDGRNEKEKVFVYLEGVDDEGVW